MSVLCQGEECVAGRKQVQAGSGPWGLSMGGATLQAATGACWAQHAHCAEEAAGRLYLGPEHL